MDPLRNPKDPLRKSGPEHEQALFRAVSVACSGYPTEAVLGVAVNLMVNAVRQGNPRRDGAQAALDELVARARTLLLDQHYDLMGARRNVFPFHQVVQVPLIDTRRPN
jgi:hypothetical protein